VTGAPVNLRRSSRYPSLQRRRWLKKQTAGFRDATARFGSRPVGNSEAEFAQGLNAELEKWRAIVKDSNIKLE
jgi:hypothetical protein